MAILSNQAIPFFEKCRRLLSATQGAVEYLLFKMGQLSQESENLETFKQSAMQVVDDYIDNRILYAQDLVIQNGLSILSEKREETILVYGN